MAVEEVVYLPYVWLSPGDVGFGSPHRLVSVEMNYMVGKVRRLCYFGSYGYILLVMI